MSTTFLRVYSARRVLLILLLIGSVAVSAVMGAGPGNSPVKITPGGLNITNNSFTDAEMTRDYAVGPTPITIFKTELNESTLPAPRDMGFGPRFIGLSIDPRVLIVCFAIILAGLVAWFLWSRRRRDGGAEEEKKE
jgi:hypothetical protein